MKGNRKPGTAAGETNRSELKGGEVIEKTQPTGANIKEDERNHWRAEGMIIDRRDAERQGNPTNKRNVNETQRAKKEPRAKR